MKTPICSISDNGPLPKSGSEVLSFSHFTLSRVQQGHLERRERFIEELVVVAIGILFAGSRDLYKILNSRTAEHTYPHIST